jgi:hypothetical protein
LGTLALGAYGLHALVCVSRGAPEQALWACHVATLFVGLGLLTNTRMLLAVGTIWLTLGTPLWLADLALGAELWPTSWLTHGGGWLIGLIGVVRHGIPPHAGKAAVLGVIGLQVLCYWWTPPAANINAAHAVYGTFRPYIAHYWWAEICLLLLASVLLPLIARLLARFHFYVRKLSC